MGTFQYSTKKCSGKYSTTLRSWLIISTSLKNYWTLFEKKISIFSPWVATLLNLEFNKVWAWISNQISDQNNWNRFSITVRLNLFIQQKSEWHLVTFVMMKLPKPEYTTHFYYVRCLTPRDDAERMEIYMYRWWRRSVPIDSNK